MNLIMNLEMNLGMNLEMEVAFDCDDDWQNAIIPNLISEREKKILEERQKVEDADNNLIEELFSGKKTEYNIHEMNKPVILDKKRSLNFRREKMMETHKQKSELIKRKKAQQKRVNEIYGEAELDEYYEMYGAIQDKY